MAELPKLLQRLRSYRGRRQTQLGLRLLLLTGVRTGELRQATPDQFDLARGLWIIPPEVVKQLQLDMRKKRQQPADIPPYIVPLSIQAMEIVRHPLDEFKPAQRYLFRHDSDLKKRISENTLNGALKRMGYQERLTGHGIRGTMSTALNEIGYPKVWVDSALACRSQQGQRDLQPCRVRGAASPDDAGLGRSPRPLRAEPGRGGQHATHRASGRRARIPE